LYRFNGSENWFRTRKTNRGQSDKIGRLKYNQQLLKQTLSEVEEVKLMLRTIFAVEAWGRTEKDL
jgi:hypothetical protein